MSGPYECCKACVFRGSDVCDECDEADQFELDQDLMPDDIEDAGPLDLRELPFSLEAA